MSIVVRLRNYSGSYFQERHCRAILIQYENIRYLKAVHSLVSLLLGDLWSSREVGLIRRPPVLKCSFVCFLFKFTEGKFQNLRLIMLDYFLYNYTVLLRMTFYKA